MAVDIFTPEEFLVALPVGSKEVGYEMGERIFRVPVIVPDRGVDGMTWIKVRSSIHNDKSAGTGEDSIRLYLVDRNDNLIAKLDQVYVTRVSGWQRRLEQKIDWFTHMRVNAGDCPDCKVAKQIWVTKNGPNTGRPFTKCGRCGKGWAWLDQPQKAYFLNIVDTNRVVEVKPEAVSVQEMKPAELPSSKQADEKELDSIMGKSEATSSVADLIDDDFESAEMMKPVVNAVVVSIELNDQQREIVNAPINGAMRVLAAPGSGKTATIKYRYRRMIDSSVDANKILAVTFSGKMAEELAAKIKGMCPEIAGKKAEYRISTIHASCIRILKDVYPEFQKVEVAPQWLIKKTVNEIIAVEEPDIDLRPAWEETYSWICMAKSYGFARDQDGSFFQNALGPYYGDMLTRVRRLFDEKLAFEGKITFPDMLLEMELRLNSDKLMQSYVRREFTHVIVDEAQDTNGQAMRILTMIANGNILVVGDSDQLLYRFTGATPEENLFEGFEQRWPNGQLVKLPINYRSTREVVDRSRQSIANNYQSLGGPYADAYKKDIEAWSTEQGQPFMFDEYSSPMEEAKNIYKKIKTMTDSGYDPGDFFIGFRTRAQGAYVEMAMSRGGGIPFINTTGSTFWSLGHVQDLIGFLRLAVNKHHKEAFKRVVNIPSAKFKSPFGNDKGKYVGHHFLGAKYILACNDDFYNSYDLLNSRRSDVFKFQAGGWDLYDTVKRTKEELDASGIPGAIAWLIENVFRKYISFESGNSDETLGEGSKVDDLYSLLEVASEFEEASEFLKFIDTSIAASQALEAGDWTGRVVISTIHKLKGLERPVVFGVGISEYDPMVANNPVTGLLPHTFSLKEPPNTGVLPGSGQGKVEDERCLFFVLISRAKKEVYLSSIRGYRKSVMRPSRFLGEIGLGQKYLEQGKSTMGEADEYENEY